MSALRLGRTAYTPAGLCRELLSVVQAQDEALGREDFEAFERLAGEREVLQQALAQALPAGDLPAHAVPAVHGLLLEIAELDRRSMALARELLESTRAALRQLRQGQTALHGYGRPGAHVLARPGLLDQAG